MYGVLCVSILLLSFPAIYISNIFAQFWGSRLGRKSATVVSYAVEPFLPSLFSHSSSPSAYPPDRSRSLLPLFFYYAWRSPEEDALMHEAARQSAAFLRAQLIEDGQGYAADAPVYGNYAIYGTPLEGIYGSNLPKLRGIKKLIDPDNVMGLAGGIKL